MARIPEAEIERLKTEIAVERLVEASGIALKKSGKDQIGKCPFHDDAEPSLVITSSKNLWHCFGCQVGGGPIDCGATGSGLANCINLMPIHSRCRKELLAHARCCGRSSF